MDRTLIDRYAAGAGVPLEGIAGLTDADLDAVPVPGTWTVRQIVVHLMDSDLIGSERMKRVAAMDGPALLAYDEGAFADRLNYHGTDAAKAARLFALNRELTADVLRSLPPEAFARAGHHSEKGRETLEDLVRVYAEHLDHHMGWLRRKRAMLGKPPAAPGPCGRSEAAAVQAGPTSASSGPTVAAADG